MTRVCLLGESGLNLQYELLSRETSREALSAYDLERPFENSLAVRTISVGAAVSLLNDLQWYLTRFVAEALVQEPSVDDSEWLSRKLATKLRNNELSPEETDEYCKVYGIETVGAGGASAAAPSDDEPEHVRRGSADVEGREGERADDATEFGERDEPGDAAASESADGFGGATRRLVEPLYARRVDGEIPEYDLRDVEDTLVVRVTREEFVG